MQKWKIPLYKIFHDESDEKLVQKVISRGMDWAIGPEIAEFEKLLANYVGTSYCVTFNSGTSALHAAILALKIKKEIIVPSFSFIATSNSVLMANTRPVFADIEKETFGIDPKHVKKLISKKTGSIIPVHYSGMSCKIDEILQLSKIQKIPVIEDCAESLGATNNGKKVGTFGDASIFSFAPNKIISTGEGGAVLTNSKKLYEKLKLIRSHGRKETQSYF